MAVYLAAFGAVAQLGERDNRTVEVRGSIPLGSTSSDKGRLIAGLLLLWVDSGLLYTLAGHLTPR